MAVANLYNIPTTPAEMAAWSFAHMTHHRDVIAYIQRTKGIKIPLFAIDPFLIDNQNQVAYLHQIMHTEVAAVLNLSAGYDLLDVDWKDEEARANWIFENANTHFLEAQATGVD